MGRSRGISTLTSPNKAKGCTRGAQGGLTRPQLNARSVTGVDSIGKGQGVGKEGGGAEVLVTALVTD